MNKLQASHTSLAIIESLTMPLVQEVVLSADVRCKECQKRITHVLSRINAETDSVVVDVLKKKALIYIGYPIPETRFTSPCTFYPILILFKLLLRVSRYLIAFSLDFCLGISCIRYSDPMESLKHKLLANHELETAISMSENKYCCMMMRISIDCKGCQRKLKRILLSMKEVETHAIERQYNNVSVCGRFRPADVAVKIQNRMNRRVWIHEIQEFDGSGEQPIDQSHPQGPPSVYC